MAGRSVDRANREARAAEQEARREAEQQPVADNTNAAPAAEIGVAGLWGGFKGVLSRGAEVAQEIAEDPSKIKEMAKEAAEDIGFNDAAEYVTTEATKLALYSLTVVKPEFAGIVNTINSNDQLVGAIGNYLGDDLSRIVEMASTLSPDGTENLTEESQKAALEALENTLKNPVVAEDIAIALNNMAENPDTITMTNFQALITAAKSFDITNPDVGRQEIQQAYVGLGMSPEDANEAIQSIYDKAVQDIKIDTVLAPIVNGDPDMKGVTDAIKGNPELSEAIVNYIKSDINAAGDIKELFTNEDGITLTGDAKIAALKTLEVAINDPEKSALMTKAINNIAADPNDNITVDGLKELNAAIDEYSVWDASGSTERVQKAFVSLGMTEAEANEAIELEALNRINGSGLGLAAGILTAIGLDPSWLMGKLADFLEMIGVSSEFTGSLRNMFNENGLAELPEFAQSFLGTNTSNTHANSQTASEPNKENLANEDAVMGQDVVPSGEYLGAEYQSPASEIGRTVAFDIHNGSEPGNVYGAAQQTASLNRSFGPSMAGVVMTPDEVKEVTRTAPAMASNNQMTLSA